MCWILENEVRLGAQKDLAQIQAHFLVLFFGILILFGISGVQTNNDVSFEKLT